jgi:hypothetical protein
VAGVVDEYIEATLLGDDGLDGGVDRALRSDVKLNDPQVDVVLGGVPPGSRDLRCVAAGTVADAGVGGVARRRAPWRSVRRSHWRRR